MNAGGDAGSSGGLGSIGVPVCVLGAPPLDKSTSCTPIPGVPTLGKSIRSIPGIGGKTLDGGAATG